MSALTNAVLAPFALIFRLAYARPWLAIFLSGGAAIAAELFHRELIMGAFACFAGYMLIWLDESEHPQPVQVGSTDNLD